MDEKARKRLSDESQIKFYKKRDAEKLIQPPTGDQDRILLVCKIYGDWSFSGVMRNLAKGLKYNGVDVSIAPEEYHTIGSMPDWEIKEMINKVHDYWNRVVLRSCEGDHMYLMPPGIKRIAHTTGESSYVNKEWIQQLNATDLVLTTSNFFKGVLEENNLTAPVSVLPNSVNLSLYDRNVEKYPFQGLREFNFFSMFHFGERKAPEVLMQAFIEEFKEDEGVTLTVHSLSIEYAFQQGGMTVKQWLETISKEKHAPIYISQQSLRETIIPHYIKNFDCFVLPTRGEGFGLPVLECSSNGA